MQTIIVDSTIVPKLTEWFKSGRGVRVWTNHGDGVAYLGDASEEHDIEMLSIVEMSTPPASFCAQWNAVNA